MGIGIDGLIKLLHNKGYEAVNDNGVAITYIRTELEREAVKQIVKESGYNSSWGTKGKPKQAAGSERDI